MKLFYDMLAVMICILTLGFFTLRIRYSDGTKFEWIGWIDRIAGEG